jgi:hypothetical protein
MEGAGGKARAGVCTLAEAMLGCTRAQELGSRADRMSTKVFLPQDLVDSWVTADKVELTGETMTFRSRGLTLRLVPGFYFDRVSGGSDDGHQLLGRAKSRAAISALGAEVYMNSVLLGETAYEVEAGFIAKPTDTSCTRAMLADTLAEVGF